MKKCSRYIDALEDSSVKDPGCWQDVVVHAGKCPDCSSAMKLRSQMLELLAEVPEPQYPVNLHGMIMESIGSDGTDLQPSSIRSFLGKVFDSVLQPLEVIIPVACLIMFAFLVQIDKDSHEESKQYRIVNTGRPVEKSPAGIAVKPEGSHLEKVTVAEVKDFLRQLEEFRRTHPESQQPVTTYAPAVQLVNDKQ